jgi:hypothetical protein
MILERFEAKRVCQSLGKKGYQLTAHSGDHNKVRLYFMKISEQKMSINPVWELGFWGLPERLIFLENTKNRENIQAELNWQEIE